jgi:nucleoside-diphosphate-sugar epimerase
MNILILGGNRFVGKKVADMLSTNHTVTVFNRSGIGSEHMTVIQGDRNTYTNKFDGYDIILDFCLFKPEQAKALLSQISPTQKYMFISSAAVYNHTTTGYYTEDMISNGKSSFGSYAHEKAQCEKLIMNSDLDYIILRPTYIVGPGSHRPRLSYYINKIETGQPVCINGDGSSLIDLVYVDDIVDTIINMVNNWTTKQIYNIGGSVYTVLELVHMISYFLRQPNMMLNINADEQHCPFPNIQLTVDTNKLNKKFKPLIERMPEFYTWYHQEGKKKHGYE